MTLATTDFALNSNKILDPARAFIPLNEEQTKILAPTDPWTDDLALKIAVADFNAAQNFRSQNHDWRWRTSNELYLAWVSQKYWEGTKIPRSSIPVFLVFQQVESLLARLMSAIFADEPWFQVDPGLSTTAEMARDFRDRVLGQLDEAHVREVFTVAIKNGLIYGAGPVCLNWEAREEKVKKPSAYYKFDPQSGKPPKRIYKLKESTDFINRPTLDAVPIEDFYVDPNAASPSLQHHSCQYVVERKYKDIEFFNSLRGNKEFDIPSNDEMKAMLNQKPSSQGDSTKSTVELMRMGYWAPQTDQSTDPAQRRLELIVRTSKDRVVWVLNRTKVIYNKPNPYGFINYYNAFYADVPGRFYGLSLCDVLEGEQRFRTSLINARVDELALSIHAPVQYKRGLNIPSYQLRTRPGQMIQVETPGEDYQRIEMGGVTQNAYIEDQASDARSQKITGLSDLIASGVPSGGGNAAGRTATGIGAEVNAGNSRIQGQVERLEDTFIEAVLNDVIKLNIQFPPIGTPPQQIQQWQNMKFYCRASTKMKSQQALLQTMPLFLQTLLNPAFIGELTKQGVSVNFKEVMQMLLDTTSFKNRADIIRQMSQQEIQQQQKQAQQQQQQADQAKMQMAQQRAQGQLMVQNVKGRQQLALEAQKAQNQQKLEQMKQHAGMARDLVPSMLDQIFSDEGEPTPA